jgi:hypothetical protein
VPGPVLAGILTVTSAEDVLSLAFDDARRRSAPLRVLAAGLPAADQNLLADLVGRWAEKYPEVPVVTVVRGALDPAITLAAETHSCCLAVVTAPDDARGAAVIGAVQRRARCPVVVI